MKVSELIYELQKMPQDAEVKYVWDGHAFGDASCVWLSNGGYAVLCDYDEVVYKEEDRPHYATIAAYGRYWNSPSDPNPEPEDL